MCVCVTSTACLTLCPLYKHARKLYRAKYIMITLVTLLADGMSHLTLQVMYVYLPVDTHSYILSPHQWSPLHWAAREGHVNTVKCLVENGAEVNNEDYNGVNCTTDC